RGPGSVDDNDWAIITRRIGMSFGHAPGRDGFHFTGHPASVIVIVDHQVHEDAARFFFIQEPVACRFLRTINAAMQTEHSRLADVPFGDGRTSERVFGEEADHMRDEELYTCLATGSYHFLSLVCGA